MYIQSQMPRRQGRATVANRATRFDPIEVQLDPDELAEQELRQIKTEVFRDTSRTILSKNNSPDVGFDRGLNAYRGCEHGCIYCYARTSHEFLGYSAGLDFETKILVKPEAVRLLTKQLSARSWKPQMVLMSGNTDAYQPLERKLKLTRGCLEIFREFMNPVGLITKNHLITRDLDLLEDLARHQLVHVRISITSLNPDLTSVMEPRTSRPSRRLDAIEKLADRGIDVGVNVAPVIPGLTDDEMPAILEEARDRGATSATYIMVRLPGAVRPLFMEWLNREFPDRARKVKNRLLEIRGGELSDSRFGTRMRGEGLWADTINRLFKLSCSRLGLRTSAPALRTDLFQVPAKYRKDGQIALFDRTCD